MAAAPDAEAGIVDGRRVSPVTIMERARRAGALCGVTRLADVTRLDRVGFPVWQAIRPAGLALSVHQGKGATNVEAQVGALLEAVESDCAERFRSHGSPRLFQDLPDDERAPSLDCFSAGAAIQDRPIRWTGARNLVDDRTLWVPEACVSLDLSMDTRSPFERSSTGLAVGADLEDAATTALLEVIERDAMIEWRSRGIVAATQTALDTDTIPFAWLRDWRDRLAAERISMRLYEVDAVIDAPVFACELNDLARPGLAYRATHGSGCAVGAERALFRALAEAMQSRATYIAGARDDFFDEDYAPPSGGAAAFAFGLPPVGGGRAWRDDEQPTDLTGLVAQLVDAGFAQIGIVALDAPEALCAVKAMVPGLGSLARRRVRHG